MSFYCLFIRLVLFAASYLILCYLMSLSIVCFSLKCIGIKFNVIWPALYFTNAYVDIILRAFRAVGTDLSPLIATHLPSCTIYIYTYIYIISCYCVSCYLVRWDRPHRTAISGPPQHDFLINCNPPTSCNPQHPHTKRCRKSPPGPSLPRAPGVRMTGVRANSLKLYRYWDNIR